MDVGYPLSASLQYHAAMGSHIIIIHAQVLSCMHPTILLMSLEHNNTGVIAKRLAAKGMNTVNHGMHCRHFPATNSSVAISAHQSKITGEDPVTSRVNVKFESSRYLQPSIMD